MAHGCAFEHAHAASGRDRRGHEHFNARPTNCDVHSHGHDHSRAGDANRSTYPAASGDTYCSRGRSFARGRVARAVYEYATSGCDGTGCEQRRDPVHNAHAVVGSFPISDDPVGETHAKLISPKHASFAAATTARAQRRGSWSHRRDSVH